MIRADFVVIGGGIAGVSAAANLAAHGSVTLLEMESSLAYHTTGRSAAVFVANYGAEGVRPLARASLGFLKQPPAGSVDGPLLSPRGLLWIATEGQMDRLDDHASGPESEVIDSASVAELLPVVRRERIAGGVYEPEASDIDVAALHQAFVRLARRDGASIETSSPVIDIAQVGSGWLARTPHGDYAADVIVNATGAWGDRVASLAGVSPVGLQPMRRTAFMVPGHHSYSKWPLTADAEQRFYFKPDGVQLLCSPSEETPSEPTDPCPRMEDVALAIDRICEATTLSIRTVNASWVGLRTFAPDREMVIGEDPQASGFYWLVGQGGTGIQTAPACGALLAALVSGEPIPVALAEAGADPAIMSPARFR
ncbi:MAG: FAD-binding oxidoreductase [Acidimicrobiia bacterium]|nr:FAD-binding oxidoreductase [Acidimicrobiia bacterium]